MTCFVNRRMSCAFRDLPRRQDRHFEANMIHISRHRVGTREQIQEKFREQHRREICATVAMSRD
jgi:hypothetical protein